MPQRIIQYQAESKTHSTRWYATPEEAWEVLQRRERFDSLTHMPGKECGDGHWRADDNTSGYVSCHRNCRYYAINWKLA